jgi:hypothetical protein
MRARPDALPYTCLIDEHVRAAANGDRSALARAFQVLKVVEDGGVELWRTSEWTAI